MKRAAEWVLTLPQAIAVLGLLVIFDPVLRLARSLGQRRLDRAVSLLGRLVMKSFVITGVRVEVERRTRPVAGKGYLLVANHQSFFDVAVLVGLFSDHGLKFVAKRSLTRWIPSVSYYLRRGGHALIDRNDPRQSLAAIGRMGAAAQALGAVAMIYPEGTRARDGELGEFKGPGTRMLLRSAPELSVIPVTIDGSWKIFEHNALPLPLGVDVRVRLGETIARGRDEHEADIVDVARADISAALDRWRSEAD